MYKVKTLIIWFVLLVSFLIIGAILGLIASMTFSMIYWNKIPAPTNDKIVRIVRNDINTFKEDTVYVLTRSNSVYSMSLDVNLTIAKIIKPWQIVTDHIPMENNIPYCPNQGMAHPLPFIKPFKHIVQEERLCFDGAMSSGDRIFLVTDQGELYVWGFSSQVVLIYLVAVPVGAAVGLALWSLFLIVKIRSKRVN